MLGVNAIFPKGPGEVAGIGQGGYVGGVAHMRMYKSVWTEDMIRQYQEGASAKGVRLRECKNSDEFSDDPEWTDAFGHGCSWFAVAMQQRPLARTCDQIPATVSCPVACESVTKCWGGPSSSTIRWLLESPRKRLQHLRSPVNTTICAGKSLDRAAVLDACRAVPSEQRYLPVGSLQHSWLYHLFGGTTLRPLEDFAMTTPGVTYLELYIHIF